MVSFVGLFDQASSVFVLHFLCIGMGVIDIYLCTIAFQLPDDIDDAAVADIGTVFFKRDAQHQNIAAVNRSWCFAMRLMTEAAT